MAKKRKKSEKESIFDSIASEVKHSVLSILFIALTVFFILSPFGKAGPVGDKTYELLHTLLGVGYYLLPLLLTLLAISLIKNSRPQLANTTVVASFLFFISTLGMITLLGKNNTGGWLGEVIEAPLVKLFDVYISFVFLLMFSVISLLVIFNARPSAESLMFWRKFIKKKTPSEEEGEISESDEELEEEYEEEDEELEEEEEPEEEEEKKAEEELVPTKEKNSLKNMFGLGKNPSQSFLDNYTSDTEFVPPPLKLLSRDKGKPGFGDIKANTNIIKRSLQNFGINVEMDEVSVGPTVTRYSLKPAEGVKLSRIVGLQNDLSLALAAHPIRIEAPIPGKSLVGIEIPNSTKTTVGLVTLLQDKEYQQSQKSLLVALGKSISGRSHFSDLAKMPHLLIAGATGSGKSVTVHALINSMLFRNSPENLRFILIDPKRVELTLYNDIPHLLTPVITNPKKAIRVLQWATKEMERRYDILEAEKVRDIGSYHKNIYAPALKKYLKEMKERSSDEEDIGEDDESPEDTPRVPERMPYIVIIIDELADIMTAYPRELEAGIVRLAQMSRAVGIHLILSTQRPSVNVITGLIKANIPARVALQVSSQIDSRTILDTGGAEKLLGAGDMLYLSGEMSKPKRIQSAFITEEEIKKVVKYIAETHKERLRDEIDLSMNNKDDTGIIFESAIDLDSEEDENNTEEDDDELYEEARELVISSKKASTSYLQRKFKIGYSRAARIIDILEERGVVGPPNGSRPREILDDSPVQEEETEE